MFLCNKVFFANSGAEANEGAIKLARIYFRKKACRKNMRLLLLKNLSTAELSNFGRYRPGKIS